MKKRIGLVVGIMIAAALLSVALVLAQQPKPSDQPQPPPRPGDPLGEVMFPPEMIMQHARELDLTQEQKTLMRNEIQKTTSRFVELQWQLQDAMEALHETMKGNSVNEQQALAQLDKVLDSEREIKRLHIGLAIRIKNSLTPEQQAKLQAMRHKMMGPGPDGPGRHPRGPERGPEDPGGPGGPPPGMPRPGNERLPEPPLL